MNGVSRATRVHRTVSGGWHLIYRTRDPWLDLRTRANIVPGLDSRGRGGFIAYGWGYELYDDSEPAWLPAAACEALHGSGGDGYIDDEALPEYVEPDAMAVTNRLASILAVGPAALRRRWAGEKPRRAGEADVDQTRSAFDHSVAHMLAMAGFGYSDIVWILIHRFPHGVAARDGVDWRSTRAARRCAAKAVDAKRRADTALVFKAPPVPASDADLMAMFIR